jgi:hypothetical protein
MASRPYSAFCVTIDWNSNSILFPRPVQGVLSPKRESDRIEEEFDEKIEHREKVIFPVDNHVGTIVKILETMPFGKCYKRGGKSKRWDDAFW